MKWFLYTRGNMRLNRVAVVLQGVQQYATRLTGGKFNRVFYAEKEGKFWWGWDTMQLTALFSRIIQKCTTATGARKHFRVHFDLAQSAIRSAEAVVRLELKKTSDIDLLQQYRALYQDFQPVHGLMDIDIDAIDAFFEDFMIDKLRHYIGDDYFSVSIRQTLMTPVYVSFLTQQDVALHKAAQSKQSIRAAAKRLHTRYWWTALGWENMQPHTEQYFVQKIMAIRAKTDFIKNKGVRSRRHTMQKEREVVMQKYRLGPGIKHWLSVLDTYAYLHDLRKEMQVKTVFALRKYLKEIARRSGYAVEDCEWLWPHEVMAFLKGEKARVRSEIQKRRRAIYVELFPTSITTLSGNDALRTIKQKLESESSDQDVQGTGVAVGKVSGPVKVCNGYQEALAKIKKGDILICGMTLPDYLPAMKKAAAIVTNEGGVTCHAAIISRELGIPCIIGTKIATKVLHDGDMVEVDAEKGIVRKLRE